jgi:CubicO group peptidase (beta-lactamase class C family)
MSPKSLARAASLAALILLSSSTTFAQAAATPDAAAPSKTEEHLRVLRRHLEAFNASDAEALKKFAAEHLSEKERQGDTPERVVESELRFRRAVGALELYEVERNTDTELTALFKTRDEFPTYARAVWKFDASNPSTVTSRDLEETDTPASALGPKRTAEALAKEVDAKLSRLAAGDKFSGAVLIAKNGRPVWQKAYGYADRDAKAPNRLDTRFRLGSMNKMFTSVSIAQLVQAGRLKYTDTLADVLPDYPNREVARKITIHQLLTHTSGLGDIFGPEFQQKKDGLHEIKDYLQLFADKPLRFEPGASWSYSNAGFIVLGLVIEKVSGQNYYDYVRRHVYDVAGMKASGSIPKTEKVPNLAVGYTRRGSDDGKLVDNWDTLPWRGMSAGGGDSTVGDLLRFAEALRSHKLLSAELTETVIKGKAQPNPNNARRKYAYGFEEDYYGGHRVVGHGGGAPGMNGELDILMDDGYTVVVLANLDPPAAQNVAAYISERLR